MHPSVLPGEQRPAACLSSFILSTDRMDSTVFLGPGTCLRDPEDPKCMTSALPRQEPCPAESRDSTDSVHGEKLNSYFLCCLTLL